MLKYMCEVWTIVNVRPIKSDVFIHPNNSADVNTSKINVFTHPNHYLDATHYGLINNANTTMDRPNYSIEAYF